MILFILILVAIVMITWAVVRALGDSQEQEAYLRRSNREYDAPEVTQYQDNIPRAPSVPRYETSVREDNRTVVRATEPPAYEEESDDDVLVEVAGAGVALATLFGVINSESDDDDDGGRSDDTSYTDDDVDDDTGFGGGDSEGGGSSDEW